MRSPATQHVRVEVANADDAAALVDLASSRRLVWADFSSIAALQPEEPRVVGAWIGERMIAAAIDDGLSMSVAGDPAGLTAIARWIDDLDTKLVISGRADEVDVVTAFTSTPRKRRPEHFMAIARSQLRHELEHVPIRVATADDLPMLEEVRARALEEEYGIAVPRDGSLFGELRRSVHRAVELQGVAIWVEADQIAFTAQLVAKTDDAAMFGDLYTSPALRGAGRATRALTAFCHWLMTESEHVTLRVGVDNAPACRLYERVGFRSIEPFVSSLLDVPYE